VEELLEEVFPIRSVPRIYSESSSIVAPMGVVTLLVVGGYEMEVSNLRQ
jgi:hypothetical protein